jgi:hypothetical protein
MQVSHVINPGKELMLTQTPPNEPQVVQSASDTQKKWQVSAWSSMGVAGTDDTKAVTTARTIAEEKRIVSEDVIGFFEEVYDETADFYALNIFI